jgi:hypothetical protein
MAEKNVRVTTEIAAAPGALYDMVSELSDMGKWSPEAQGGRWIGGATGPAVGARFRGQNRSGWRRWATTAKVTDAQPGKRFAFSVTFGGLSIADWCYEFEAVDGGTRVTETWDDRRPPWMPIVDPVVMGIPNRAEHNRTNMEATLAALKKGAEAAA